MQVDEDAADATQLPQDATRHNYYTTIKRQRNHAIRHNEICGVEFNTGIKIAFSCNYNNTTCDDDDDIDNNNTINNYATRSRCNISYNYISNAKPP